MSLFSDSLFMDGHSIVLQSSSLIKVCVSTLLCSLLNALMVLDKVVSSAYNYNKVEFFSGFGEIVYIYMINNKGPSIEPCGTPIFKGKNSDLQSSISVYCFLFLSNFQIVSELNLPVCNILAYDTHHSSLGRRRYNKFRASGAMCYG